MENGLSDVAAEHIGKHWREDGMEDPLAWTGRVGDLVVVGGRVSLLTPQERDSGFLYRAPPGSHPVYAGLHDLGDPGAPDYRLFGLFIPLAPRGRLTDAHWSEPYDGMGRGNCVYGYACLWSSRAEEATEPHWGDKSGAILRIEEAMGSAEVRSRPGSCYHEIVDPSSGANVLAFPVDQGFVTESEVRNDRGDLLALMITILD